MGVVALLNVFGAELDLADCVLANRAVNRTDFKLVPLERDEIEIIQVNRITGVRDDRAHIAGEKVFVLTDTEHEWTASPRADNKIRNVRMDDGYTIGANHLFQRCTSRVNEACF